MAPTGTFRAGGIPHRVHGAALDPRWYGRRDAAWRWNDPDRVYGVLYLGVLPVGPFAETLPRRPNDRAVLWSHILQKRAAAFVATRDLDLGKPHGEGLGWFRTTAVAIAADVEAAWGSTGATTAYRVTQAISARVHRQSTLDGVQYRSRFDNDELCIALFNRADDAVSIPFTSGLSNRLLVPEKALGSIASAVG